MQNTQSNKMKKTKKGAIIGTVIGTGFGLFGAIIGSVVPVVGTTIGVVIGTAAAGLLIGTAVGSLYDWNWVAEYLVESTGSLNNINNLFDRTKEITSEIKTSLEEASHLKEVGEKLKTRYQDFSKVQSTRSKERTILALQQTKKIEELKKALQESFELKNELIKRRTQQQSTNIISENLNKESEELNAAFLRACEENERLEMQIKEQTEQLKKFKSRNESLELRLKQVDSKLQSFDKSESAKNIDDKIYRDFKFILMSKKLFEKLKNLIAETVNNTSKITNSNSLNFTILAEGLNKLDEEKRKKIAEKIIQTIQTTFKKDGYEWCSLCLLSGSNNDVLDNKLYLSLDKKNNLSYHTKLPNGEIIHENLTNEHIESDSLKHIIQSVRDNNLKSLDNEIKERLIRVTSERGHTRFDFQLWFKDLEKVFQHLEPFKISAELKRSNSTMREDLKSIQTLAIEIQSIARELKNLEAASTRRIETNYSPGLFRSSSSRDELLSDEDELLLLAGNANECKIS